jgi:hypothetical protein
VSVLSKLLCGVVRFPELEAPLKAFCTADTAV